MNKLEKISTWYKGLTIETKAIVWYMACNVAQKAINMLVVPLYTRLLSASEYGTYSVFLSWLDIFDIVATLRLFGGAYIVGLVKFEKDKYSYTSSLELLCIILTSFWGILYFAFRQYVNSMTKMSTPITVMLFLILLTLPLLNFWKAWQRVENQYIPMVLLTLATTIFTPLFGIIGIMILARRAGVVIMAYLIVQIVISLIIIVFSPNMFLSRVRISYWAYGLKTNVPLIPYYLSTTVLNHSDRIFIQQIIGSKEAGIYSVAYSVAMIMTVFSSALNSSLQPWIFKCIKGNKVHDVARVTNLSTLFITVLNVIVVFFTPEIIRIFAPMEYYNAIWIVPPVTASVIVMYIYQQFVNVEFYYEEGKLTAVASIGAAILNVFLNMIFIPVYGYLAAGYTTLISYIVFAVFHYIFMRMICIKNEQKLDLFHVKTMVLIFILGMLAIIVALSTYNFFSVRYAIVIIGATVAWFQRKKIAVTIQIILSKRES